MIKLRKVTERILPIICILVLLTYLMLYIFLGEDTHILIHDNLDGIGSIVLGHNPEYIFSRLGSKVPIMMNGIPRVCLGTEFSFLLLLHRLFNPYVTYVINQVIMRLVALLGMISLLKNQFNGNDSVFTKNVWYGVSTCFALLPFWPGGVLTVAGLPLLINSFLNIRRHKDKLIDWIIIILMPFLSSFFISGIFVIFLLFILFFYDIFKKSKFSKKYLTSLLLIIIIYLFVNYRLVINMFFNEGFTSHRVMMNPANNAINLIDAMKQSLSLFIEGQYHSQSLNDKIVIISSIIAMIIMIKEKFINRKYVILMITVISISLLYGLYYWEGLIKIKQNIEILRMFQFHRFYILLPMFWYVIFTKSLIIIGEKFRYGHFVVYILILIQLCYIGSKHENIINRDSPTYREFYAVTQMKSIEKYIDKPKDSYKVLSIGIHPAISQYNGFYTLDGYFSNYPLDYKMKFREIFSKELEKNSFWRNYYDSWGNRCYILADELKDFMNTKERKISIKRLEINSKKVSEMGGEYILSAVEIENYNDISLSFEKIFYDNNSAWDIYLYKIKFND